MRVEIDPVAECLNGRDNPGHKLAPGDYLEVTGHRPEGAATKIPQEPAVVLEEDTEHLGDDKDGLQPELSPGGG